MDKDFELININNVELIRRGAQNINENRQRLWIININNIELIQGGARFEYKYVYEKKAQLVCMPNWITCMDHKEASYSSN